MAAWAGHQPVPRMRPDPRPVTVVSRRAEGQHLVSGESFEGVLAHKGRLERRELLVKRPLPVISFVWYLTESRGPRSAAFPDLASSTVGGFLLAGSQGDSD